LRGKNERAEAEKEKENDVGDFVMNSRLKELYRRKKFSITQLALILDKPRSSIGEWLADERKILLSIENVENYRIFLNELTQKCENENKIKSIQNERI
jgi:hypothetical protein